MEGSLAEVGVGVVFSSEVEAQSDHVGVAEAAGDEEGGVSGLWWGGWVGGWGGVMNME